MRRRIAIAALAVALCPAVASADTTAAPARSGDPIPFRKEATPGFDAGRWALGMGAAIATGAGAWWWLRRRRPGATAQRERRIKLLETLRVTPRSTLLLIEVDGRTLLIGENAGALVRLSPPAGAND